MFLSNAQVARKISANTTNSTLVQAGQTKVLGWEAVNVNAAAVYLKLYDKATAPTVGTDTPKITILIPASAGKCSFDLEGGIEFLLGLGYGIVTGVGDSDTTAPTAAEQITHIFYR